MPITLEEEPGRVFRLEMRGMLRKAEFDHCQSQLAGEMSRQGPVRLLFILDGFEGWESSGEWGDLSFYLRHGDRIERIAIVGPERWRVESLMFAAADLRKAPVEFFADGAVADALRWLAV